MNPENRNKVKDAKDNEIQNNLLKGKDYLTHTHDKTVDKDILSGHLAREDFHPETQQHTQYDLKGDIPHDNTIERNKQFEQGAKTTLGERKKNPPYTQPNLK